MSLQNVEHVVVYLFDTTFPLCANFFPRRAACCEMKTIENGYEFLNELFELSIPRTFCGGECFLTRIYRISFAALPTVKIFLPLFFCLLEFVADLFDLCFKRNRVAELVFACLPVRQGLGVHFRSGGLSHSARSVPHRSFAKKRREPNARLSTVRRTRSVESRKCPFRPIHSSTGIQQSPELPL